MSEVPIQALDDEEARLLAEIDEGLRSLDEGRSIPLEKVEAWLLSWGSDNELPPPECE